MNPPPIITNAMSVDVEDYFQVSAFENHIDRSEWDSLECRVERNVNRLLDLFGSKNVSITFFVLGWVAERYPQLVKRMVAEGHELASHGYSHTRLTQFTETEMREDVTRTKAMLEDLGGVEVRGYRAPSYSIGRDNLWALDVLHEAGYQYSSSIYPIKHDLYGMPEAPRFRFHPRSHDLLEVPVTTVELMDHKFPCGGGGYFRLFPYALSRWAMRRVNRVDQQPCIFYFHPWEIDPDQPKQADIGMKTRVRHYLNLNKTEARINRLLDDFSWDRMDRIFLDNAV